MLKPIKLLSKRLFRQNRGRNLVAALAIVLTTIMFTVLFVLSQSMSQNMIEMTFRQTGYDTHVSFKEVTDAEFEAIAAHPDVQEAGRSIVVGVAENNALAGRQVEIRYADASYATHTFSWPTTGAMPVSEHEIALDTLTLARLGVPAELGQTVTLQWKKDLYADASIESTFTLAGFWEGNSSSYASMAWVSEGFALTACGFAEGPAENEVCGLRMMQVSLASANNMEETMDTILADTGLSHLSYNINLAYDPAMNATASSETLPMYLGMVLVFIAGYLIIYNIFQISVTADIQFYGKLKTLGTTTKQLKRLIYDQANRMCLLGIPAGLLLGYLLGAVLVPVLVSGLGAKPSVSASPVIFIGSAVFAWATVLLSCLRPARIAGKVSPMEALRYNDSGTNSKRKTKKSRTSATIPGLAIGNLGRNKKRTVLVICSLTLSLVLLSCFYAKDASFDIEKYLSGLTIADFQVNDATNADYINGYDPLNGTISDTLLAEVEALEGLEGTGRLASEELQIPLSTTAIGNIRGYYEQDGRLDYMERTDPHWVAGYHEAIAEASVGSVVYGIDGIGLEMLMQPENLMSGSFDAEAFATGEYVIAFGVGDEDHSQQMPTFSVGESMSIAGKQYTVMAVADAPYPLTEGTSSYPFDLDFALPLETFQAIWPENGLRKLFFNVADAHLPAAEELLATYQQEVDSTMPYSSRATMIEQYERQTRSAAVMGNAISVIIALVGVLNFVNSMVTSIVARRQEFAMIQSVGMTKRQLRGMLVMEGMGYAGFTLLFSYLFSILGLLLVIRPMVADGFSTFQFTLLPLLLCTPILLILAAAIPFASFKNIEKQSIVERLRTN